MPEEQKHEAFVSVDVGSYSLKFAFAEKNDGGDFVLKTIAQLPIPHYESLIPEDKRETMSKDDVKEHCLKELRQFLTTHLTELLYDNEIQTKRAISFASNREVTIRCIEIPPVAEPEKLTEAVTAEANKQMPFSMGNAVLGYNVQGDTMRDEKALTQIMVAALQKDVIDYVNQNLKGGGLSNEGILTLPQVLELVLSKQMAPYGSGDKKVGLIHCGNSTTSIMIYKNGKIQFFRDVNMAGAMITDAIFAGGEVDGQQIKFEKMSEAIELKHKLGVIPPDEAKDLKGAEKFAAQKILESVEKIFQHIQLSISFYISQTAETSLDKIILTGGTSSMKNFKEFIEESLEVSTSLATPFNSFAIGEVKMDEERREAEAPSLCGALGVCMYDHESTIINFVDILFPNRKNQSINLSGVSSKFGGNLSAKLFELTEPKLRLLAVLLAILLLLIGAIPIVSIRSKASAAAAKMKSDQRELTNLQSSQSNVTALMAEQAQLEVFSTVKDDILSFRRPSALLLAEIASTTPEQIFLTSAVFSFNSNPPTVVFQGHADNSDSVFDYLNVLGKASVFHSPTLDNTQEMPIDDERYFIRFKLKCQIRMEELQKLSGLISSGEGEEEEEEVEEELPEETEDGGE